MSLRRNIRHIKSRPLEHPLMVPVLVAVILLGLKRFLRASDKGHWADDL